MKELLAIRECSSSKIIVLLICRQRNTVVIINPIFTVVCNRSSKSLKNPAIWATVARAMTKAPACRPLKKITFLASTRLVICFAHIEKRNVPVRVVTAQYIRKRGPGRGRIFSSPGTMTSAAKKQMTDRLRRIFRDAEIRISSEKANNVHDKSRARPVGGSKKNNRQYLCKENPKGPGMMQ